MRSGTGRCFTVRIIALSVSTGPVFVGFLVSAGFFDSAAARSSDGVGCMLVVGSCPPGSFSGLSPTGTPAPAGIIDQPSMRLPHAAQNVACSGNTVWQCGQRGSLIGGKIVSCYDTASMNQILDHVLG